MDHYDASLFRSCTLAELKSVIALQDKKERYAQRVFVAEGVRTVSTLITHRAVLKSLYVTEPMMQEVTDWAVSIPITLVTQGAMKRMSSAVTPSGVVGVFRMPDNPVPSRLSPGVVLVDITDSGNMGTLIRTVAALGLRSVVVVRGVDPFSYKVVQASAGSIIQVDLFQWSWDELCKHRKDLFLHALVVQGGTMSIKNITRNGLLVVGGEAAGLSAEHIAMCNDLVTLPMPGNTESLNAAVAGSIALYLVHASL